MDSLRLELTAEYLRSILDYAPETGVFRWKVKMPHSRVPIGARAGVIDKANDRRRIKICGRQYFAYDLAWLHVYGQWPDSELDHRNCIRDDDRIENLRAATQSQNNGNKARQKNNTSGFKGVSFDKSRSLWEAQITTNGKKRKIGRFPTKEDAGLAYQAAAQAAFGEFARF